MRTVSQWMECLSDTLDWLVKQTHPCIRGHNGADYDTAVRALIQVKMGRGTSPSPPPRRAQGGEEGRAGDRRVRRDGEPFVCSPVTGKIVRPA